MEDEPEQGRTSEPLLSLVVLRCADIERMATFYRALGITLARERHGSGPEHLSGRAGPVLVELYPSEANTPPDAGRIGFDVRSLASAIAAVSAAGGTVVSPARESAWGLRAVLADPEGRRVELVERGTI